MRSDQPRRYVGDDAGKGDLEGVGGPQGDGRGKEWTVELCCKRLSLLHRKLRQVKDLLAKRARNPDALDAAQLAKVEREMDLQLEISELEALRRRLKDEERQVEARETPRVPLEPLASMEKRSSSDKHDAGYDQLDGRELESETETETETGSESDANDVLDPNDLPKLKPRVAELRLAEPRNRKKAKKQVIPTPQPELAPEDKSIAGEYTDAIANEIFKPVESTAPILPTNRDKVHPESSNDGAPVGGYPKRLATLMSFCRISTRDTCELLISLGKVTVNGKTVYDGGMKVDIMRDDIKFDDIAVTLPPKIDNSHTSKAFQDHVRKGGPHSKAEKNTWKANTKYRWSLDGGLMASRVCGAALAKSRGKSSRLARKPSSDRDLFL